MTARYLMRLDDACHTMNHERWALVERMLDRCGIKPIVAVVPANRDPKLMVGDHDDAFWDKVRRWESKGWTIAMHGFSHLMHPTRTRLVLPFYERSEFAGLPGEEQSARIGAAWELFLAQSVVPQVWVAPAHSFDLSTLEAIRTRTSIRVISDGIGWDAYYEHGFHWIPQQLWSLRKRRSGLWTVCIHPNTMSETSIASVERALGDGFRDQVIRVQDVELPTRGKSLRDRIYSGYFWWRWRRAARVQAVGGA